MSQHNTENVKRILLVEDEYIARKVICTFLEEVPCIVDVAETAMQALELFSGDHDLVLLDIGLPDFDGMFVAENLRRKEENFDGTVKIIALTAHATSEIEQRCYEAGIDEVLNKPISKEDLIEVVRQA